MIDRFTLGGDDRLPDFFQRGDAPMRGRILRLSPLRIDPLATVNWMSSPNDRAVSTAKVE